MKLTEIVNGNHIVQLDLKGNIGAKPNSVNTKLSQKYLPRWLYFTKICPPLKEIKEFKKKSVVRMPFWV